MAKQVLEVKRFSGLSESDKEGIRSSFLWAEKVDFRTDPTKLTLLPRTTKESGSVVVDLPMDADRQGTDTYLYGNAGHLYKRSSSFAWSDLRTVSDSVGNGLKYYGEDGYLYYTGNKVVGRYGPLTSTPTFVDDFLGAEGGVPTNTYSLSLNGTTQYATAADSASLSQTGDISKEIYVKLNSLPDVGEIQTMMAKWNKNGNLRSYTFELKGISAYFGDGGDGALTVSVNTTDAPIDSACTGTAAAYTLTATNASFATGQKILIHQSQGTNAGRWERNEIAGYTAGTITLANALTNTYTSGAQVLVLKEYTDVTVNSGITWTAKAWNGTVGGILAFLANGTTTISGTITATGKGFRGGSGGYQDGTPSYAQTGEGNLGQSTAQIYGNGSYGSGGGAGQNYQDGVGGGGANGTDGFPGYRNGAPVYNGTWEGRGGTATGTTDLTTMFFGGGGGGTTAGSDTQGGDGGNGGGIIFITATTLTVSGAITSAGSQGNIRNGTPGGSGAGGSILLKSQVATLGSSLITAAGGALLTSGILGGGPGGVGRINLDYYTSYTGTTSPTLNVIQDNSLVTTTSYQMQLGISSNGTNEEFLTKTINGGLNTGQWYRFAVTWDASASLATFYLDATSLGTSTGTLTAIYNSTALYSLGARFDSAGTAENFLDAKIDDIRLWSDIRTESELSANNQVEVSGSAANLVAYHQVDNSTADAASSPDNDTLTLVNSPTYSTDVPFSAPTTRRDLDQSLDTSGNTYTTPVAIDEGATHRQTFVPAKDPQKSVQVLIASVGTGDWTLTVHNGLNRTVASKTVTNANLNTGDFEFIFADEWRPIIGASYHFHITSTVADGTVTTTTASDLETVDFHTYYQFLVDDAHHRMELIGNKLAVANERYIATWDGAVYNPHAITLPSGYRIRCLGLWRGYLVAGIALGTDIFDYDYGYLFFWDGTSKTYNDFVPVPDGAVNSIVSGEPLRMTVGYSGDYAEFNGGEVKVQRRMPNMTDKKYIEVAPKGMTTWRGLTHMGMGLNTDSSDFYQGVYVYGKVSNLIGDALSFDYPLSLGVSKDTSLRIGLLYPVGKSLLIGWQYGTSYGVDVVSPTNSPFATGRYESLITDLGKIRQEKIAYYIRSYFKALSSGDSFSTEYKLDRNSSWASLGTQSTADKKELRVQMPKQGNRFNEFQFATVMSTSNSTSPEYYGTAIEYDDLDGEARI